MKRIHVKVLGGFQTLWVHVYISYSELGLALSYIVDKAFWSTHCPNRGVPMAFDNGIGLRLSLSVTTHDTTWPVTVYKTIKRPHFVFFNLIKSTQSFHVGMMMVHT